MAAQQLAPLILNANERAERKRGDETLQIVCA